MPGPGGSSDLILSAMEPLWGWRASCASMRSSLAAGRGRQGQSQGRIVSTVDTAPLRPLGWPVRGPFSLHCSRVAVFHGNPSRQITHAAQEPRGPRHAPPTAPVPACGRDPVIILRHGQEGSASSRRGSLPQGGLAVSPPAQPWLWADAGFPPLPWATASSVTSPWRHVPFCTPASGPVQGYPPPHLCPQKMEGTCPSSPAFFRCSPDRELAPL